MKVNLSEPQEQRCANKRNQAVMEESLKMQKARARRAVVLLLLLGAAT
jgi:hypothetical protein